MMDQRLSHMCKSMKEAVDEGFVDIKHEELSTGVIPVVQMNVFLDDAYTEWRTIHFCPFCGESLGPWVINGKCIVVEVPKEQKSEDDSPEVLLEEEEEDDEED